MLSRATVLACVVLVALASGQARAESGEEAYNALMDLFKSTGGDKWVNSDGWGSSKPHCSWHGVTCSVPDNNVTAM